MADSAYGSPQATSGGGMFADKPWLKWVLLAGVAAGAYYLYARNRGGRSVAGTDTTGTTSGVPGYIDPTTGMPYGLGGVNMGQVGSPSTNVDDWSSAATKFLITNGIDPLAAEDALYRFLNGLSLSSAQQAIIAKALQGIGAAPGGPFPIVTVPVAEPAPAQGETLNPVTWVWNTVGPATVAVGNRTLYTLGHLGKGSIKTPPIGALIYARITNTKGVQQWVRISSLSQYANLPQGTQIAALKGSGTTTAAAA